MATTWQWQAIILTLMHVKKHYITFNSAKTPKSVGFSVVFDALTNKNVSYTYAGGRTNPFLDGVQKTFWLQETCLMQENIIYIIINNNI